MAGITKIFFITLFLFNSTYALADELAYTCEVKHIYRVTSEGSLDISNFEKTMNGSAFSVSRLTGEIIGEVIPTLMAKSTRVVNKGSARNSFKTVADFGNQVQILEVKEFIKGPVKPFVSSSMGGAGIVTGLCK